MKCELCELVAQLKSSGALLELNDHWSVNNFQGESNRPRWVIQSRRHVERFEELTPAERAALGDAIALTTEAVRGVTGAEKVYVQSFNETPPGHIHIHIVPRFDSDQKIGPELEDLGQSEKNSEAAVMAQIAAELPKQTTLPFVARFFMAITGFWSRKLSLYRLLSKRGAKIGPFDAAEFYVISWFWFLVLLVSVQLLIPLPVWLDALFAVFASYRLIDIGTYVFGMLLSNRKTHLMGLSRSLILMITNLLESSLAATILLNTITGASTTNLLSSLAPLFGFELVTTSWPPLAFIAYGLAAGVFFICAVLALAIVVGKIGERFSSNN